MIPVREAAWADLRAELTALLATTPGLAVETEALVWQVFEYMHRRALMPALAPGFACSVRFVWPWPPEPLEVDVCDGFIETYQFIDHGLPCTRCMTVSCLAGEPLPEEITEILPLAASAPAH